MQSENKPTQNFFNKVTAVLFSRQMLMFIFFFVIAAIAWLSIKLSEEYRVPLEVEVCLYSSTNKKMTPLCSEEPLPVVAKTAGFRIVQHRLTKPPVVYVDLQNQRVRQSGSRYYMLVSSLKNDITQLLNDDMQIESYGRDTLFFESTKIHENIPLRPVYGGGDDGNYSSKRFQK